ncbi:hypothetical protein QUB37_18085 [Microcoleus sp. AT3-A2]|uniref:hypothetical protein n=1 Tax=Microcoleus sp. AT3-A2 TaxID=2818610 RepID=UPI002FD62720
MMPRISDTSPKGDRLYIVFIPMVVRLSRLLGVYRAIECFSRHTLNLREVSPFLMVVLALMTMARRCGWREC